MSAVLAARMGDSVGNHSSGFLAGLGLTLGLIAGALIGAALIVATGGAALLVVGAAVAGAICITAAAGAAGERLGEAYDTDNATGVPCSPILLGCPTVLIEHQPAARIYDISTLCLITKVPATIKDGSGTVYIGKQPASRHKDSATCTGTIIPLTKYTYIGGPTVSSPEPYQETTAGFLHDMGSALEVEAKYAGYAALALGALAAGPAIMAGYAATGLAGGALAAGIAGGGLALGYGLSVGGSWAGQKVGAAVDSTFGYTDGRYEAFLGSWGGIAGGLVGGKIAEVAGAKAMKAAGKGGGGAAGEGEGGSGPEGKGEGEEGKPGAGEDANDAKAPDDPNGKEPPPKTDDEGECPTCDKSNEKAPEPDTKATEPSDAVKEAIKDLPPDVQEAVAKSPKLQAQLEKLVTDPNNPWKIKSDPNAKGAYADRTAHEIVLGKGYDNANVLAHEVGHASYDIDGSDPYVTPDKATSRDDYINRNVDRNMRDEGEAAFNEQDVSADVVKNGGQPTAPAGDNANIYNEYKNGNLTRDQAVQQMGDKYRGNVTSTTGQSYGDYYAESYQQHWDTEVAPARTQQALDQARASGKITDAEYNARTQANQKLQADAKSAWEAYRDFRAGKITAAEYTAKVNALSGGGSGGAGGSGKTPVAAQKVCPTCGGAEHAPLASDQTAPAPAHDHGLTPDQIKAITDIPKGSRPPPDTYLDPQYVKDHLALFKDGAAKFQTNYANDKYGPAQRDGSSFMMPKAEADAMQAKYANDPAGMEKALGLDPGTLSGTDPDGNPHSLVRTDVPNPNDHGLTVPTGNEAGAHKDLWIPGGQLPDGSNEGVLSTLGSAPKGTYPAQPVNFSPGTTP